MENEQAGSRGYRHRTTYIAEGTQARVFGHFTREQTQAAVMRRIPFSLRFWGLGGGARLDVRAVSVHPGHVVGSRARMAPSGTAPAIDVDFTDTARAVASRDDAARSGRRALTSPALPGDDLGMDGGVFDAWPEPDPPFPVEPAIPEGGGGGGFQHAAVTIRLFAPGLSEPVQTWELPEEIAGNFRTVSYEPEGFPTPDAPVKRVGWWRVTATPVGPSPVILRLEAHATHILTPFRTTTITKRLFDHLFRVVLEALVPRAFIEGNTLRVGIGKELADEFGVSPTLTTQDISPIVSHARLASLNITAVSGRDLRATAQRRGRQPLYLGRVRDDDIAIRIQAAFERASASVYGFDIGRLDGEFGELFLSFNKSLTELSPAAFLDVDFSRLAGWAIDLASWFTEVDRDIVNTTIESAIMSYEAQIRTYLREVLSRAVGQRAVLHEVSFGGDGWHIRYFDDPVLPPENTPWRRPLDDVVGGGVGGGGLAGGHDGLAVATDPPVVDHGTDPVDDGTEPASGEPVVPEPADPPGVLPPGFIMEGGPALERLDRHQTLVVIMMENRSYDHLLGGLATARPRGENGYDGPPSNSTNASAGGLDPVRLVKARDIGMGTAIPVSPSHHYHPVLFQIGDGTTETSGSGGMAGFARDVHRRTDSPQLAMTMYGEEDLPIYYKLADQFCVCDRWFCSHPGPTWPNRFAMLMGSIPELDNFEIDDPQIGFLKHHTIFDTLTTHGIEWRVFESDLSIVRMFDRYRMDDRHVVPIDDEEDGLDATLRSPLPLPRVLFVEPNFADLPPLATANDDHPPADLAAGQAFIARVCDAIWSAGRFDECLLVITYDEHGGFYDHVPPPGTPRAEPTPLGPRSKLHPEGPEHLGPRVPAFIVSPYVGAGVVTKIVFDHTSILKTILVHNRARIQGSALGLFGDRVNAAAHLGQALDRDSPRQPPLPFDVMRQPRPTTGGLGDAVGDLIDVVSPDGGMDTGATTAAPPLPPRTVTIVPRTAGSDDDVEQPQDYHAALRRALKPRP